MPVKRFDELIKVMAEVRATHPDVELTIVGDGAEREHLEALIDDLDASDWVSMPGRLSDEALVELYRPAWAIQRDERLVGKPARHRDPVLPAEVVDQRLEVLALGAVAHDGELDVGWVARTSAITLMSSSNRLTGMRLPRDDEWRARLLGATFGSWSEARVDAGRHDRHAPGFRLRSWMNLSARR